MPTELYRRVHNVSHFQIDLRVKGSQLVEHDAGGTLVSFAPGHINVATAWDENGSVPPHVEIIISGYEMLSAAGLEGVIPVAAGILDVGKDGVEVGNYISNDLASVAIPEGQYMVTVFIDKLEPMTARLVHFYFRTAP